MKSRFAATRLFPASGGFDAGNVRKVIRFVRMGCTNRPFYHIVVAARKREQHDQCIEQVGSYDPLPNEKNEKLVAINFERVSYWIGQGVGVSRPVSELFGIAGLFPIHPRTYMTAWRNRKAAVEKDAAEKAAAAKPEESPAAEQPTAA
ncbi:probable 28S ribosomal protein S16, mitochondrial [Macrosteles quadrilineatus]|uniref:probable 28S ribosomal protein S16, mitochondrial n=1 Tax=Macrosteles quadrilineatus TaxID=74068 RepID=UPI0023E097F8|nr:probable 28S ribosomal protein S16, mitochondrial [Macrosteles quadrilineatus]